MLYHKEMEDFYKKLDATLKSKKTFHLMWKGWWNDDLPEFTREIHEAKKQFVRAQKANKQK